MLDDNLHEMELYDYEIVMHAFPVEMQFTHAYFSYRYHY